MSHKPATESPVAQGVSLSHTPVSLLDIPVRHTLLINTVLTLGIYPPDPS